MLFIITTLLVSVNSFSQFKSNLSLNIGEKYLTDWKGRYGFEYGLSYSHVWLRHISSSISFNLYGYHKSELQLPPRGYVQGKEYIESNLAVGYYLRPKNTEFDIHSTIGINYRKRTEVIVVGSGITSGGWAEVIGDSYIEKDIGMSFSVNVNYLIFTHLSFGIYTQFKFYPSEITIIYPEEIPHGSPNTVSYGLSCGFNF